MNSSQRAHVEQNTTSKRKPYVKPQLQIYGDLREITQTVGEHAAADGGTGKSNTKSMV